MADPTDDPTSAPSPVTLRGGDLPWRPVAPQLRTVRLLTLGAVLVLPLLATVVVAVLVTPWVWLGTLALVLGGAWGAWVVGRQVSAISWVELDEEIVIRKGRLFRSLVSVPYGRLQYVDIQSGPLARAFGIAACEIHTASPESGGSLPGLPTDEAEALRSRLAARGEAQRAGL
ncbi:MAG: PH domain-containing protein [Micrococcales bacterium]|uniref:PH domain-containing protein n=1 Tax=Phycicoccus sp. TaxID=1902410 RepID=UPI0019AAE79D|nr:PH domain-containing protein [Phycicoccus sp.]MBD3782300.1 PH domain-containing protein [Micrococcales bacterium]HMM95949.1 PH domain-containing protein [Phycicoccus sp.]